MYVCLCKCVTDHEIRDVLADPDVVTVDDVGAACGAGTGCGSCREEIGELIEQVSAERAAVAASEGAAVRIRSAA